MNNLWQIRIYRLRVNVCIQCDRVLASNPVLPNVAPIVNACQGSAGQALVYCSEPDRCWPLKEVVGKASRVQQDLADPPDWKGNVENASGWNWRASPDFALPYHLPDSHEGGRPSHLDGCARNQSAPHPDLPAEFGDQLPTSTRQFHRSGKARSLLVSDTRTVASLCVEQRSL